ncbi:MMPL family transporter [Streptomyces sp. M19]
MVFASEGDTKLTDPPHREGVERAIGELRKIPQAATVSDPFRDKAVSPSGRVALAYVQYTEQPGGVKDATLDALERAVRPAQHTGCGWSTPAASIRGGGSSRRSFPNWSAWSSR